LPEPLWEALDKPKFPELFLDDSLAKNELNRNDSEKYFKPILFYDILSYLNHNTHNSRIGVQ
jgi:hypothetical protein